MLPERTPAALSVCPIHSQQPTLHNIQGLLRVPADHNISPKSSKRKADSSPCGEEIAQLKAEHCELVSKFNKMKAELDQLKAKPSALELYKDSQSSWD